MDKKLDEKVIHIYRSNVPNKSRKLNDIIGIRRYTYSHYKNEAGEKVVERISHLSNIEYARQQKYFLNQLSPEVKTAYRQLRQMWNDNMTRREFLKSHPGFKALPSAKFLYEQVSPASQLEKLNSYISQFKGFASPAISKLIRERLSSLIVELGSIPGSTLDIDTINKVMDYIDDNINDIPAGIIERAYDIIIDSNNPNHYKNYSIYEQIEKINELVIDMLGDFAEMFG